MTKNYYFKGKSRYAMVYKPDEKYDVYKIGLYMDDDSFNLFEESGCQLKVNEDDEGRFVTFKRKTQELRGSDLRDNGPPKVLDKDGESFSENIGNGSEVIVKVEMFDTRNGVSHRLAGIMVEEHIPYEGGSAETVKPDSLNDVPEF